MEGKLWNIALNIHMYCECLWVNLLYKNNKNVAVTGVMVMSSNENIFRVTGHLCGEFTGPGEFPHTKASGAELLMLTLIYARINGWVNNREAGDLGRHPAHYDVIVMWLITSDVGNFLWPTSYGHHMHERY